MESCYVDFLQMKKLTTVCCAVTILSLYFIICYSFVLYLFWHGCKDSFGVCCQYLVDEGGWTPSTLGLPVTRHHFLSVFLYFCILCHIFVGSECLHLQAPRPSQSGYQHVFRLYFNVFNLYYCCDWFFYHKHRTTRRFLFSVVSLFKIVYWLYLYGRGEFVFVFHLNCIYMAGVNGLLCRPASHSCSHLSVTLHSRHFTISESWKDITYVSFLITLCSQYQNIHTCFHIVCHSL